MILEFSLSSGIACVEASVWQRVIYIYIYRLVNFCTSTGSIDGNGMVACWNAVTSNPVKVGDHIVQAQVSVVQWSTCDNYSIFIFHSQHASRSTNELQWSKFWQSVGSSRQSMDHDIIEISYRIFWFRSHINMSSEFSAQGSTCCAEACRERDQAESCITRFAGQRLQGQLCERVVHEILSELHISCRMLHMYPRFCTLCRFWEVCTVHPTVQSETAETTTLFRWRLKFMFFGPHPTTHPTTPATHPTLPHIHHITPHASRLSCDVTCKIACEDCWNDYCHSSKESACDHLCLPRPSTRRGKLWQCGAMVGCLLHCACDARGRDMLSLNVRNCLPLDQNHANACKALPCCSSYNWNFGYILYVPDWHWSLLCMLLLRSLWPLTFANLWRLLCTRLCPAFCLHLPLLSCSLRGSLGAWQALFPSFCVIV